METLENEGNVSESGGMRSFVNRNAEAKVLGCGCDVERCGKRAFARHDAQKPRGFVQKSLIIHQVGHFLLNDVYKINRRRFQNECGQKETVGWAC